MASYLLSPPHVLCCPYLQEKFTSLSHVQEDRRVVVLIQYSNINSARGTAWWCPPILHQDLQPVAGLLLPVQALPDAQLPWRTAGKDHSSDCLPLPHLPADKVPIRPPTRTIHVQPPHQSVCVSGNCSHEEPGGRQGGCSARHPDRWLLLGPHWCRLAGSQPL